MARTNGPIQVWHRTDTIPTDAEGGYAGGDSTAAAVGGAMAQAGQAVATVDNLTATATALPPGSAPTVTVTGPIPNKVINIGVPRGEKGADGMGAAEGAILVNQAQAAQSAAQSASSSASNSAALAAQAQAAALEVPDANMAAILANPATETGTYALALPRYIPGAGSVGPIGSMNVAIGTPGNIVADDLSGCTVMGGTSGTSGAGSGYANVIGNGIIANIGTGSPNYNTGDLTELRGTNASISTVGSYDNVAAGLASVIWGFHCYTTSSATHGTISGGSFHGIDAGDYNTIGGGSNNKITGGSGSTIAGGRNHTVGGAGNHTTAGSGNTISSGQASTAIGSANNVSNSFATAIGTSNTIAGERSTAIGAGHQITSSRAFAVGEGNTVDGLGSFAGGIGTVASAAYSFAYGQEATASAAGAVAWGRGSHSYSNGMMSNAYGSFNAPGDAQTSVMIHRWTTSNATPYSMSADGTSSSVQFYNIPEGGSVAYSMQVVARNTATGDTKAWRVDGAAKRVGSGSASLVGSPVVTVLGEDTGTSTWTATALTQSNRLVTRISGQESTTIQWVSRITLTETFA